MILFQPIQTTSNLLDQVDIKEGQLIFTTDDKKIYLDSGNIRIDYAALWMEQLGNMDEALNSIFSANTTEVTASGEELESLYRMTKVILDE